MMKLTNPFKSNKPEPRTVAFTFKLGATRCKKLLFLKEHTGTSKTSVLEDLIDAGYEAAKKAK